MTSTEPWDEECAASVCHEFHLQSAEEEVVLIDLVPRPAAWVDQLSLSAGPTHAQCDAQRVHCYEEVSSCVHGNEAQCQQKKRRDGVAFGAAPADRTGIDQFVSTRPRRQMQAACT